MTTVLLLLGVEQLEDALGAGGARLDGGGHAAQLGQGLGELLGEELCALGLSMVKPCASIVSEKSIVAPPR